MKLRSQLSSESTERIQTKMNEFLQAWNLKDLQQFGELFTEEAEFTDVVGQVALGKQAIIEQHRFPFGRVMKDARLSFIEAYIRNVGDDLIILSGTWQVEGSQTPDGKPLPTRTGTIQIIWKKLRSDYKIILVHNVDHALAFDRRDRFLGGNN